MVKIVLYKMRVGWGSHFDWGMVSPEMFIRLHFINPVTVDYIGSGRSGDGWGEWHAVLVNMYN